MEEITAIGHRVVHGGEKFQDSTLITLKSLLVSRLYRTSHRSITPQPNRHHDL